MHAISFKIRRGFRFSPPLNEPVTAQTFKHSLERAFNPKMKDAFVPAANPHEQSGGGHERSVFNYRGSLDPDANVLRVGSDASSPRTRAQSLRR